MTDALFATYVTENIDHSMLAIDETILNGSYPVPVRCYVPDQSQALPVAIFLHGGGHMTGSVNAYDGITRKLAKSSGYIIVSVDYRLSPEVAYPTALEDCQAVLENIFNTLDQHQIKYSSRELTLIGDSAGGTLCTSLVMDSRLVTACSITKQVLLYPLTDFDINYPSVTKFGKGYLLDVEVLNYLIPNYFQNGEDYRAKSPLRNSFYPQMPETLVIVVDHDPLHDSGVAYQQKLNSIGVKSHLITMSGLVHAYLMLENVCRDECTQTYQHIAQFLQN